MALDRMTLEMLVRRAGLEKALAEFPDDVAAAAEQAANVVERMKAPTDPRAEPWPPMRAGAAYDRSPLDDGRRRSRGNRRQEAFAGRVDDGAVGAHWSARPEATRLYPTRCGGGVGRPPGQPKPRSWPAGRAVRCTAYRSASRTSLMSPACRRPAIRKSWSTMSPPPTRSASPSCAAPARSCSASCRRMNSRLAGRASTCLGRRPATRGTPTTIPAARPPGSGAGVAGGLFPLALGSDTGGSVRNPASACGIVGLKPTYGLVSRRGVFPLSFTLDHVGPLTRTVADNALLLEAIAGHDPLDPGSAPRRPDITRPPSAAACAACVSASCGISTRPTCRPTRKSPPGWSRSRAPCSGRRGHARRGIAEPRRVRRGQSDHPAERGLGDPRAVAARTARRLRQACAPPPVAGRLPRRRRLRAGAAPPAGDDRRRRGGAARGRCAAVRQRDGPAEPYRRRRGDRAHLPAPGADAVQCHRPPGAGDDGGAVRGRPAAVGAVRRPLFRRGDGVPGRRRPGSGPAASRRSIRLFRGRLSLRAKRSNLSPTYARPREIASSLASSQWRLAGGNPCRSIRRSRCCSTGAPACRRRIRCRSMWRECNTRRASR